MAWQNAFADGPRTVSVWWDAHGGDPAIAESMSPGDSALVFAGDGVDFHVSVSAEGAVSLTSTAPAVAAHNAVILVDMGSPSSARISALSLRSPVDAVVAVTSTSQQASDILLSAGPPVSPDPAVWPAGTDVSHAGMYAQWGGTTADTTIMQFTPEFEVAAPVGHAIRQQTVHRVRGGYADTITCYVRTEASKYDLSGKTVTAEIRAWGADTVLATLTGSGDASGKAVLTMPSDLHHAHLTRGLHRFDVLADGAPVYTATLEIV